MCDNSYARCSEKRFTQIYEVLYGDAVIMSLWGAQIWPPERGWIGPLINQFYGFPSHSLFRPFQKKIVIWGADFPGKASTSPSPQDCGLSAVPYDCGKGQHLSPLSLFACFCASRNQFCELNLLFLLSSFLILATTWGARFTLWKVKNSTPLSN